MSLSNFFIGRLQSHRFVAILTASVVCPSLFILQTQISLPSRFTSDEPKIRSASFFKFSTAGYWPAAVDWMWIQTLQLVGEKSNPGTIRSLATGFYEIATDLDPEFYEMYEQAGVLFGFTLQSADQSIHFLEKGIRNISPRWTHAYTLHLLLAYYYSYEKNDWAKAREQYLRASELPGSPSYLKNMRTWLNEKDAEKILARKVLTLLVQQTKDELLKKEYEERLKSL